MATKKEIMAKLDEREVEYDPKASASDLLELLKEDEADAGDEVDTDTADEEESVDDEEATEESGEYHAVHFKIRNPNAKEKYSIRTFSRAVHGKKFMDLANSFELANTHTQPTDLLNKEEVDAHMAHNRDIKHHIISKEVE